MESQSVARQTFHLEIQQIEHDVLDMGSRAEAMIARAIEALASLDHDLAMETIRRDDEIDEREHSIEERCLKLLMLQQPAGSDFRTLGTAIKMITDIERIADLAVDIAKVALKIEKELGETNIIDLPRMGNVARAMFREALEAFVRRDMGLIERVIEKDDEVDEMYRELRAQIHADMRANPESVVADGWLLLAIHHVERIADHAVNIAERVAYLVTGAPMKLVKEEFRDKH
jgi:phosphate transport system protein